VGKWDLGERLRRLRFRKGYSIYDVQKRTNYHYTTISKYERNERMPSLEALRELAACYEVTIAELLADEEELVESLPTELQKYASLLLERRDLAELLELLAQLPERQVGHLIDFLKPLMAVKEKSETPEEESSGDNW